MVLQNPAAGELGTVMRPRDQSVLASQFTEKEEFVGGSVWQLQEMVDSDTLHRAGDAVRVATEG
jgi:hypothetical protein